MVIAASFSVVKGDLPSSVGDLSFNCKEANDEIDIVLADSNYDIKSQGEDNMLVDYYGFDSEVSLYAFGWKLPIAVSMSVSSGNLTGINTLIRSTDAADCSTLITRTLEGIFEYGPELSLAYDVGEAKFLYWKVEGKFIYKPKPRMHVALLNGTFDCRLESITSEEPGVSEYIFETENSWKGWLISKLLILGLRQKDDTALKSQVDLWSQGQIAAYFTKAWCST